MPALEIKIGNFETFIDGVEAAEIEGLPVDRMTSMIAVRPPFRDPKEAELLSDDDLGDAVGMAVEASGAGQLALRVGMLDKESHLLVVSRSGALALRCGYGEVRDEVIELISLLDDGNFVASCLTQSVQV